MAEAGGTSNSGGMTTGGAGGVRVPQEPSLKAGVVLSDERVDFLREQAFCVLRVKTDKWNRFIAAEENQKIILDFLDHIWMNRLLLFTGPGGTLHAGDAQEFVRHHRRFVEQNKDFDQRLGTVLNLAFHHSKNLNSAFKNSKANVEAIQALMVKLSNRAFITRKSRDSTLLNFSDIEDSVSKQQALISSTGEQIHKLLQENQSLLDVSDQISGEWSAYTEYVDRMIVTGFVNAVRCSLQYFMDNTDATQRITPLFEVKLILNGNEMTYDPSLDLSVSGNLYNIMDKMVTNIAGMASFIPRVQLQNILMSKYVEYFQAEVSGWQRKLMVADLVISSWMSVQRTWAHLNSIFTNSDDIRCQLANDAERFQGIHTDFQVTRHLLKLFDNIADLRFKDSVEPGGEEEDGVAVAVGMYSREREYVPFSEKCICEGQ
ncbi:hypothetical protein GOODEAATRI_005169, partial [Goodea atripinnis]